MIGGQHVLVVVRAGHLADVARADFLATYYYRYINYQLALAFQFLFKCDTFWRTCQIGFYRLVGRGGECDN